jgi:hypothetical protein
VAGSIDLNGSAVDVLDLEKAIAASARIEMEENAVHPVEAVP